MVRVSGPGEMQMNARQENKIGMGRSSRNVLVSHDTLVATRPALIVARIGLIQTISSIETIAAAQMVSTKGATADKAAARVVLAGVVMHVAGACAARALLINDHTLLEQVDVVRSDLLYGRDSIPVEIAIRVQDAAAAMLPALAEYGVDAAKLTELATKLGTYQAKLPAPRDMTAFIHAKTVELESAFVTLDEVLARCDKLMETFAESDPVFFTEYHAAREIVDNPGGVPEPEPASPPPPPPGP